MFAHEDGKQSNSIIDGERKSKHEHGPVISELPIRRHQKISTADIQEKTENSEGNQKREKPLKL